MSKVVTPNAQDAINRAFASHGLKPTGMPFTVEAAQVPVQETVGKIFVDGSTGRMHVSSAPGNDIGTNYI